MYNIAGLHVEISRHEKVLIFLYLNVISWGLLLNSVPKIYSILQNNRRHLKVSHNQRINTAEFLRIPPSCGPRIFEACTRKVHKKSKNYASSRGPIEHLVIHLADSTRYLQDDSARGSAGSRMRCCCFSHSAHWLPTRKKTTLHGGQSRSWSAEQGKKEKEKVWQRTPPPPRARCSFGEKIKKLENKKLENHAAHPHV